MSGDWTANVTMHYRVGWKKDKIPESSTTDVAFHRSAAECFSTCTESSLYVKPENGNNLNSVLKALSQSVFLPSNISIRTHHAFYRDKTLDLSAGVGSSTNWQHDLPLIKMDLFESTNILKNITSLTLQALQIVGKDAAQKLLWIYYTAEVMFFESLKINLAFNFTLIVCQAKSFGPMLNRHPRIVIMWNHVFFLQAT